LVHVGLRGRALYGYEWSTDGIGVVLTGIWGGVVLTGTRGGVVLSGLRGGVVLTGLRRQAR
jgi:hypothetical protein